MSQLSPVKKTFSIAQPIPLGAFSEPIDRRRYPHSGPKVDNDKTKEIQKIKSDLSLTTKEFAKALSEMDKIETSPETLQAYIQGYISSEDLIEKMLGRMRLLLSKQSPEARRLSGLTMVEIIDSWLRKMNIDPLDSSCPWRKISKVIDKNHSIIFRWHQENRKPRSIATVIAADRAVDEFVKAHPTRTKRS